MGWDGTSGKGLAGSNYAGTSYHTVMLAGLESVTVRCSRNCRAGLELPCARGRETAVPPRSVSRACPQMAPASRLTSALA
jgi:hypothetical protein